MSKITKEYSDHKKILLFIAIISLWLLPACQISGEEEFHLIKVLQSRPSNSQFLYDYAKILENSDEYTNRYLKSIRDKYAIEAMIVSLPSLEDQGTIEDVAVRIVDSWKIGKDFGGRGILLLFAKDNKLVKLEVTYELEDVFTDIFCGYIANMQLKPYFFGGDLGTGLLAVMEELENRARIRHQGEYTKASIDTLDTQLLSGGAGAKRDLTQLQRETVQGGGEGYPAGNTPGEAWQTLIQSWRDKVRNPNLGVYTDITKLAYRDYQNLPDSRYEKDVNTYANKPFKVIQNENYAVIFFGNKKGWENAPFLFARTDDGWSFDIVHQRKYVRMGPSPHWGIEKGTYPYIDLLSHCPSWMGQDIPLEGIDTYRVQEDKQLAEEILHLEREYKNDQGDFEVALELGKKYVIASMGQKRFRLLNKAKKLNPEHPQPYKYLAIAYVDSTYQYKKALKEMSEYVKRVPDTTFGHNYSGYLYLSINDYDSAIKEFKKAISLRADNSYAYCKLSRAYGSLYLDAARLDPRRNGYKKMANKMLNSAKNVATPDDRRVRWLEHWLVKNRIRK
jgi:tetratricopeptide (TPR) repeat protein